MATNVLDIDIHGPVGMSMTLHAFHLVAWAAAKRVSFLMLGFLHELPDMSGDKLLMVPEVTRRLLVCHFEGVLDDQLMLLWHYLAVHFLTLLQVELVPRYTLKFLFTRRHLPYYVNTAQLISRRRFVSSEGMRLLRLQLGAVDAVDLLSRSGQSGLHLKNLRLR